MAVTKRTRYEVLRRPALTGRAGRGATAPRLTPEQRDRILTILRPARVGDAR